MSGVFSGPSKPDLPEQPEPIEEIQVVDEDAEAAKRREKKKLVQGGRSSTILSGIASALKKRLGE